MSTNSSSCSIYSAPNVYIFVYIWIETRVAPLIPFFLENTKKGSSFVTPSLSSSYLFELNFHHLHLAVHVIGRWNELIEKLFIQDNTFQNILCITCT